MATRKRKTTARKPAAKKKSSGKKWMQKAFANSKGQFKSKAKRAGQSTVAYANSVTKKGSTASTKTKRQANLVKTVSKINSKRKKK